MGGVPVGVGNDMITGDVYFVHSGTGNSGYTGKKPSNPLATWDQAVNKCTADQGDHIFLMPGHAETITAAAQVSLGVAGVTSIGLGNMTNRPMFTFSTATTADINVSAANNRVSNIRCVSGINSLVNFFDLDAGQFSLDRTTMVTSSANEALAFIDIATTNDDYEFTYCDFLQPTDPDGTGGAAGTGAIYCVDTENIYINECRFRGQFETAIVHNKTTKVQNLIVRNSELSNALTVPFVLVAASTGICTGCYGETLVASDATEAQVYGTIGTRFWIDVNTSLGNDSGGGGQGGVTGTVAS